MIKNLIDNTLHALGGAAIAFLIWLIANPELLIAATIVATLISWIVGYFRELEQQKGSGGSRWAIWELSRHKHIEAMSWGVGAIASMATLTVSF